MRYSKLRKFLNSTISRPCEDLKLNPFVELDNFKIAALAPMRDAMNSKGGFFCPNRDARMVASARYSDLGNFHHDKLRVKRAP